MEVAAAHGRFGTPIAGWRWMDVLAGLTRTWLGLFAGSFACYLVARGAVEFLKIMPDELPVMFPMAGFTAGLLVVFPGSRCWAAIILGAGSAALVAQSAALWGFNHEPWDILVPAASAMITPPAGALIYRRLAGESLSLGFRSCAAIAAPAILCASLGLTFSYLRLNLGAVSLLMRGPDDWRVWLEVWLAGGLGVLLAMPLVIRAAEIRRTQRLAAPMPEILLVLLGSAAAFFALFFVTPGHSVMALAQILLAVPILLLVSARFGAGGTVLAGLFLAGAAAAGTSGGYGPLILIESAPVDRAIGLQMYLTIIVASAMLLGGAIRDARVNSAEVTANEERLRAIAEHLPCIIYAYLVRPDGSREPLYSSPGLPEVQHALGSYRLGGDFDTFLGMIHPDDRENYRRATERARADRRGFEAEYRIRVRDGEYRWLRSVATPMQRRDGTLWCGLLLDITASREAARALVESEQRLRAVLENAPNISVQGYDARGRVVFWNKASERSFGFSEAQAVGKTLDQLILDPSAAAEFQACIDRIARTGTPAPPREWKCTAPDGSCRWMYSSLFRLPTAGDQPLFICMDVDVTDRVRQAEERRALDDRVRELQRRESIGVLAGGVAHDFNNMLGAILGNADLALAKLPEPSEERRAVETIRQAATRAADLTRQLLDYAGRGRFLSESVNLPEIAREVGELLAVSIGRRAAVEFEFDPDTPLVRADATQVRQVVMNLLTNAAEAIEGDAGRIVVRTGRATLAGPELARLEGGAEARPGEFGFVQVGDNGRGMDDSERSRAFEPFFTTKFAGRGLGLAATYGIVQSKGGAIDVQSRRGEGSTFTVYLPVDSAPAPAVASKPELPKPPAASRTLPTALLVEDESMLRELVGALLKRAGYGVHAADDGDTALELLDARGPEIEFVVLDLSMPRMSGEIALGRMRQRRPGLPVLVTSGNPAEDVAERMRRSGPTEFLRKPFRPPELLAALDRLLATARATQETL